MLRLIVFLLLHVSVINLRSLTNFCFPYFRFPMKEIYKNVMAGVAVSSALAKGQNASVSPIATGTPLCSNYYTAHISALININL